MDFDAIESLNEDELNSLYDEFNSDMDGVRSVQCVCGAGLGSLSIYWTWVGGRDTGGCRIMQEVLRTQHACFLWCRRSGLDPVLYVEYCWCEYTFHATTATRGTIESCVPD